MTTAECLASEFSLVGELKKIVLKSKNYIQYLQIVTEQDQYWVKVSKALRKNISQILAPGCWLKISGKQKLKSGKVEFKAYTVEVVSQKSINLKQFPQTTPVVVKPQAKVMFCQKSSCWKRGGKTACELLEATLRDRGLADQVEIKTTGCLKQCKKAPNMIIMPDKTRYSQIKPRQIPDLIEKHLIM